MANKCSYAVLVLIYCQYDKLLEQLLLNVGKHIRTCFYWKFSNVFVGWFKI